MKISYSGVIVGSIAIVIAFLLLAGSWGSVSTYNRLRNYNGRAEGHITKKYFLKALDGNATYYLNYWFMANGNKVNSSSAMEKQYWDALRFDDTMEIRFDQSDPGKNVPLQGGSPSLVMAAFMVIMGAVFMIFGGSRLYYSFNKK